MGGGRGMDRQAARVADIGDMVEEAQRVDKLPPGIATAFQLEADQSTEIALKITLRALPLYAALHRGMDDLSDASALGEIFSDLHRIRAVTLHPEGEGFHPLKD